MTTSRNTNDKGLAAPTTNPDKTKHYLNFTDNSSANQRLKLLAYLQEHGSITTWEARQLLDIYNPSARKCELVQEGYPIDMVWDNWTSEHGIKHRIGRYVLTQKQPVKTISYGEVM